MLSDESSLKFAGIIASELGNTDEGRRYFTAYLELNPGDVQVRQAVAQELQKAGDDEGALDVIEKGFAGDSVSVDMLKYAGYLALQAAGRYWGGEELTSRARRLFEKSVSYYGAVLNRDQADAGVVINMLLAYETLGNDADAAALCERTTGQFPNANLLTVCAQGRKKQGNLPKHWKC